LAILCDDEPMAEPYSDDLRCKLLEAYEAGAGSLRELAAQFRVSWGYSKKIRAQQLESGQKTRPAQQRHGPVSRMSKAVEQSLRDWLREQPDLTEAELRERLAGQGVAVCQSRVGQVLRQMGLRRKKNPSMPSSATARPTRRGAKSSSPSSPRSRRNG
jgi:transposase